MSPKSDCTGSRLTQGIAGEAAGSTRYQTHKEGRLWSSAPAESEITSQLITIIPEGLNPGAHLWTIVMTIPWKKKNRVRVSQ